MYIYDCLIVIKLINIVMVISKGDYSRSFVAYTIDKFEGGITLHYFALYRLQVGII